MKIVPYEKTEMCIIECDCGFHIGLDSTFMLQERDFTLPCPACGKLIDTRDIENMEVELWPDAGDGE